MSAPSQQQGFSTVELLISLFIAAAFIATGFQLFFVVIEDGNETRLRSRAGNVAYETLRRYSASAPIPCSTAPGTQTLSIPTSELPAAEGEVTYSCPYGAGARTTRVNVSIEYGDKPELVEASLDVTR